MITWNFIKIIKNRKNIQKMGCETSKEENHQIVSIESQQQFKLSYRELVTQDRGHIFQLYQFSTILNRSNYSIVRKVISRASQQARVCKIIPLENQKYFSVISQIQFLKKLDHPNIAQIIQYFLEPSFLYIVLENVPGDRILRQLNKMKEGILFSDIVEIMKQLLRAVDFCHRKSIAHRAITTQNVLLFFSQSQPFLKLIDFSQACTIGCTNPSSIPAQKRNVILKESEAAETDKIDIYDCGIVFYTLLSGKRFICNDIQINYRQMLENSLKSIRQANLSKKVEKDLTDLLNSMLAENPKSRLSALQCLNHGFFKNFQKNITSKKALQSLMKFQPDNNLKYLLSMYASINMTSALEKAEHLSQFYSLDTNKDGQIQLEELIQGIQNTFNFDRQKSQKYAEQMFANLDKNKSGSVNFSQYITGTVQLSKLVSNDFLQKMFNQIDINRDGYISEYEVNNLTLGIDRYKVLDGKKQVNFNSFKKMMLKMLEKQKSANIL